MRQNLTRIATLALAVTLLSLLPVPSTLAAGITNGDFESVAIPGFLSSNPADILGWTHTGAPGDALIWRVGYFDTGGSITITGDGNTSEEQFVTLGPGHDSIGSADWQTTITGLIPGSSYVLSFETATETSTPQSLTVMVSGSSTPSETFTPTPSQVNYWTNWVPETYTFVAPDTSAVVDFGVKNTTQDMGLDAVSIAPAATTVPEPSALLLFGSGLLSVLGAARRRWLRLVLPPRPFCVQ